MPRKTNFTTGANSYFRTTATVGKTAEGKPIRKQFYGKSRKEAEAKRDEYVQGLKSGLSVGFEKTLFGIAFRHWLYELHSVKMRLATMTKYETLHRLYIADCTLSGMKLIDVRPENVQAYINHLTTTTTVGNVYEVFKLLKTFIAYCIEVDALVKSPLRGVKLPEKTEKTDKNTALADTDIEKLITACNEDIRHFPFLFIAFSGCRSGELRALTFGDIDLKSSMIDINKQVRFFHQDGEYKPVVSTPKTSASIRRVPIADTIKPLLQVHINALTNGGKVLSLNKDIRLLFPSLSGTYHEQNNFLDKYQRLCDTLRITQGRTIHSLRHTYCTLLARSGVSLLDASRLMGHKNINVTAAIYSHVNDEDKKKAVSKLSAYFS